MSELREAAERAQMDAHFQYDIYIDEDHDSPDELQIIKDMLALATYARKLTDPTPLSELTDEQWREMGFCEYDKILYISQHRWSNGRCSYYYTGKYQLIYDGRPYPTVRTLGQLRALMFAIGGES